VPDYEWEELPTKPGWYTSRKFPFEKGYNPYYVRSDGRILECEHADLRYGYLIHNPTNFGPFRRLARVHRGDED